MEKIFYNALAVCFGGNYIQLSKLKKEFKSWKKAFDFLPKSKKIVSPEEEWKKLEKLKISLSLFEDNTYPPLLREISHPPFGIYVKGIFDPNKPSLAIVGTRKSTIQGKEIAKKFSFELSRAGLQIISGLALGIDAAAHRGCLDAGGQTIAVLANGLEKIYPRFNEKLGKEIIEKEGAIISEYPIGTPILPYRFLERNRIISGLSRGVLVVEAPKNSGSLVTARFGLEQNRDIFVIPGPINHPNFAGSNQLIREGGELVVEPQQILESLNIEFNNNKQKKEKELILTKEEKIIFEFLKEIAVPVETDKIIEAVGFKAPIVNQLLSFMVIKNIIKETDKGYTIS